MDRHPDPARAAEEVAALATASDSVAREVNARLADIAAHARGAVVPGESGTVLAIRRSPSYQVATARLAALADAFRTMAADFRVAEYRTAHAYWFARLPPEYRRPDAAPDPERLDWLRTAPVRGLPFDVNLLGAIDRSQGTLLRSIAAAGRRSPPPPAGSPADPIGAWARSTSAQLIASARRTLVDVQSQADRMAGRDVVALELLEPDPEFG